MKRNLLILLVTLVGIVFFHGTPSADAAADGQYDQQGIDVKRDSLNKEVRTMRKRMRSNAEQVQSMNVVMHSLVVLS